MQTFNTTSYRLAFRQPQRNVDTYDEEIEVAPYTKKIQNGLWIKNEASLHHVLGTLKLHPFHEFSYEDENKLLHRGFIYKENGGHSYIVVKSILTNMQINLKETVTDPSTGEVSVEIIPIYLYGLKVTSVRSIDQNGNIEELDINAASELMERSGPTIDSFLQDGELIIDCILHEKSVRHIYENGKYTPYENPVYPLKNIYV